MKKLFFLIATLFMVASFSLVPQYSKAQIVTTLTPTAAKDTLTNADTAYVYISSGVGSNASAVADANSVSVRAHVARLSGTAAGTVTLQGNLGSGDWNDIDTTSLTNVASQAFDYSLRNSAGQLQYTQYRLKFITSGTVSAIPTAYLLRRRQ